MSTALIGYEVLRPAPVRNFGVVQAGVLYRSGQLTSAALDRVLAEHGCRTVVTLRPVRDEGSNPDIWEAELCSTRGVRHIRIGPGDAAGDAGLDRVVEQFLAVMGDPANHPVLVHCLAGRDRTGTVCAAYRMEFDRWAPAAAAAEMGKYGFDPNKDDAAGAYQRYVLS